MFDRKIAISTLLLNKASILVTKVDQRREISGGGLFVRDGRIKQAGATRKLPGEADEILDLSDHTIPRIKLQLPPFQPDSDPGRTPCARYRLISLVETLIPKLGLVSVIVGKFGSRKED